MNRKPRTPSRVKANPRLVAAPKPGGSSDYRIAFTFDERDRMDLAKGRIRDAVTILQHLGECKDWACDEDDHDNAVGLLADILREAIVGIDETFETADERQTREKGGAR